MQGQRAEWAGAEGNESENERKNNQKKGGLHTIYILWVFIGGGVVSAQREGSTNKNKAKMGGEKEDRFYF